MWKNPISDTKEERVMEKVSSDSHLIFLIISFYFLREREWRERETDG